MFQSVLEQQISEVEASLVAVAESIDPDAVPASEAPRLFERLDQISRAASGARTLLARRMADSLEWQRKGFRTPEEHLATMLGTLRRGQVQGEELCEITGVGPVPVRVARQLLGDATLKLIITRGVDVANVTSLGRGPTAAMRTALLWTSPTCVVEGCSRTITEHDHRTGTGYNTTRHTRLDEIDELCNGHHDLHTHHGWALVHGKGKRAMVPPDDPRHPSRGQPVADGAQRRTVPATHGREDLSTAAQARPPGTDAA